MMTFAWSLQQMINEENGKPEGSNYTINYVGQLAKRLNWKQYLYTEMCWRDPL